MRISSKTKTLFLFDWMNGSRCRHFLSMLLFFGLVLRNNSCAIVQTNSKIQKKLHLLSKGMLNPVGGGQGVRQGALKRDVDHPVGIICVLHGHVNDLRNDRRNDSKPSNPKICIMLKKVSIIVPPFCEVRTRQMHVSRGKRPPR